MKKRYAGIRWLMIYGMLAGGMASIVQAELRITNEPGGYSFVVPDEYGMPQEASGTSVTLTKNNILSALVPNITISVVSIDEALEHYDQCLRVLKRARYNRAAGMRLLKKSSLKTSRGIPGWELSYLQLDKSGNPTVTMYVLLDRDTGHMLQITGTALQENRTDFALVCDDLINSVEYGTP